MIELVVDARVRPGRTQPLLRFLDRVADAVRANPECIWFDVRADGEPQEPEWGRPISISLGWRSAETFERLRKSAEVADIFALVASHVAILTIYQFGGEPASADQETGRKPSAATPGSRLNMAVG
ncbi:hypothetical protein GR212_31835 [Rhizobium lusitanum]|uniref:Antibiotic biosynthesis monooxygenase n=1 Tax=Rhizobium lusitanum TaxID=293958 RepID=A0A6L9UFL7_9HYPH|nr:hypothetical protein [Rhizobium lusitanum]NEI74151.1 hypothetical protein [Rhizobium lusitanum]